MCFQLINILTTAIALTVANKFLADSSHATAVYVQSIWGSSYFMCLLLHPSAMVGWVIGRQYYSPAHISGPLQSCTIDRGQDLATPLAHDLSKSSKM